MDKLMLIALLCLSSAFLSQAVAAPAGNGQQEQQQPASDSNTTSNALMDAAEDEVKNPVTQPDPSSLSECRDICNGECDEMPSSCEFIDGALPVNCGNKREDCYADCNKFCKCQFDCGCLVAHGCGDDCTTACKRSTDFLMSTTETTVAVERGEEKPTGVPVIYVEDEATKPPKL